MNEITWHYDLLIDEGNDPVHDPEELRAYMDLWDGEVFLSALALNGTQSVLEFGVGTGRLALRIAPQCRHFTGIDLSPKTIAKAIENLTHLPNVFLCCGDFLTTEFSESFDVICSSLTMLHIKDKKDAMCKIASLLTSGGRVVLSLDKNQVDNIDYGTRRIRVYPDNPAQITTLMVDANLVVREIIETEFAFIIVAERR